MVFAQSGGKNGIFGVKCEEKWEFWGILKGFGVFCGDLVILRDLWGFLRGFGVFCGILVSFCGNFGVF